MLVITPSGNGTLSKTASSKGEEIQDALLIAAKKGLAESAKNKKASIFDTQADQDVDTTQDVSNNVGETTEIADTADTADTIEKIKDVETALEDVLNNIKDITNTESELPSDTETTEVAVDSDDDIVEITLDDSDAIVDEVANEDECEKCEKCNCEKGECKCEDEDKDIIVESEDEDEGEEKTANTVGRFTRIASLSKETRDKVYDYYVNQLGYPKDYCKLMVTDYEK